MDKRAAMGTYGGSAKRQQSPTLIYFDTTQPRQPCIPPFLPCVDISSFALGVLFLAMVNLTEYIGRC